MSLIIVKQGQWAVFEAFRREFADEPRAQVIWDRRGLADRRHVQYTISERPIRTVDQHVYHRADERGAGLVARRDFECMGSAR